MVAWNLYKCTAVSFVRKLSTTQHNGWSKMLALIFAEDETKNAIRVVLRLRIAH